MSLVLSFKYERNKLKVGTYTSPGFLLNIQARVLEKEKKRQAIYREEAKRRRYQHYLKTILAHRLVLHSMRVGSNSCKRFFLKCCYNRQLCVDIYLLLMGGNPTVRSAAVSIPPTVLH